MPRKLVHYLRQERRRAALTQADIAALLGGSLRARVSRYERGRIPPAAVLLAYEAILGKPVADLLGGLYDETVFLVRRRAQELLAREARATTRRDLRRRRTLERIAA